MIWILYEISSGFIVSAQKSEPNLSSGLAKIKVAQSYLLFQDLTKWKYQDGVTKCSDEEIESRKEYEYEIEADVDDSLSEKDILSVNYKTELKNGKFYTPVHIKHKEGINSGLIDKTEYYRNYVDDANKGQLVLVVSEVYVIDNSEQTLPNSAKPSLSREKTWKHVKNGSSSPDENKKKSKSKLYNTRTKRHKEGIRRRENIMEQYIDHIGIAGVLCGAFSGEEDAFNKLTSIQTLHAAAFTSWINSGRDPLYTDLSNDSTTSWLNNVVPDNVNTQAMIPWIIGKDLREYTIEKLKGNIK